MKQVSRDLTWLLSLLLVCILQWQASTVQSAAVKSNFFSLTRAKLITTDEYLHKYGYLTEASDGKDEKMKRKALMKFQQFCEIPTTGIMDSSTTKMMTTARCGMKDFHPKMVGQRQKRYKLSGVNWNKKNLTYLIRAPSRPTGKLNREQVKDTIKKSFEVWAKVTTLTFTEVYNGQADIVLQFVKANHADSMPFDGLGGVSGHALGTAFGPKGRNLKEGAVHFDDEDILVLGERGHEELAVDFYWLAVHEIGHVLGLRHSSLYQAAMFPYKKMFTGLHEDDINGVTMIYGKRGSGSLAPANPNPNSYVCQQTSFDAVVYEPNKGSTYFFKKKYFWERNRQGEVLPRRRTRNYWKGLRGNLNAAYTKLDGTMVFFKGSKYWTFYGMNKPEVSGNINDRNIPSELSNMDAALIYGTNSNTYFFKGDQYWQYDEMYLRVEQGYPKSVQDWGREFNNIDAAFKWADSKTYIFKGTWFYEYDQKTGLKDKRDILKTWFGC